jgi:hypothetical protein
VAHNIEFDDNVVTSELIRYGCDGFLIQWSQLRKVCTMRMGTLPRQKWPKLSELYVRLFNREPEVTLHRADADVHVCAQCFFRLTSD